MVMLVTEEGGDANIPEGGIQDQIVVMNLVEIITKTQIEYVFIRFAISQSRFNRDAPKQSTEFLAWDGAVGIFEDAAGTVISNPEFVVRYLWGLHENGRDLNGWYDVPFRLAY